MLKSVYKRSEKLWISENYGKMSSLGKRSRGSRKGCNHLGKAEKEKSLARYHCMKLSTALKGLISKCLGGERLQEHRRVLCFTCELKWGGKAGWIAVCTALYLPPHMAAAVRESWAGGTFNPTLLLLQKFLQAVASLCELSNNKVEFHRSGCCHWYYKMRIWSEERGWLFPRISCISFLASN